MTIVRPKLTGLIYAVLLAAALLSAGCRAEPGQPPVPTVAPSSTPTQVPEAVAAQAREAVLAAEDARLAQDAFRVVSAVSSTGADVLRTTAEYAAPDRYHLVTSEGEWLAVGERLYLRVNGQWVEQPGDSAAQSARAVAEAVRPAGGKADLEAALTDPAPLGTAVLDGQAAQVYQYHQETSVGGVAVSAVTRVWVRASDGLPVKEEIEGQSSTGRVTVVRLYEYGPGIRVDTP